MPFRCKSASRRAFLSHAASFSGAITALSYAGAARAQDTPPVEPPASAPPPAAPAPSPGPLPPTQGPPPYMVQQPWAPPAGEPPPPRPGQPPPRAPQYGPAPPVGHGGPPGPPPPYPPPGYPPAYIYEPPPPPVRFHRSPYNALWFGARIGVLFPFGNAYDYAFTPSHEFGEPWNGLASTGVALEGDLGIRVARHYILYGFWEHGELSTGSDETWRIGATHFGDQDWARTDYVGGGFRWSSRPDSVGFVFDTGLGYRWFRERWASDTEMRLGGFGEFRIGFGVDMRITPFFSLSPLFMFSSGVFTDGDLRNHGGPRAPLDFVHAPHNTVTLTLGGHFDLG